MAKTGFKLTGNWNGFAFRIDPKKFDARMKSNIGRAGGLNAKLVQREIRKDIQDGTLFQKNARLTTLIKGSTKPLVDHGVHLFQAITTEQVSDFEWFVGVLQRNDFYNIAVTLHEGASIKVTDAMRNLFAVLARASAGDMDPALLTGRAAELWERYGGRSAKKGRDINGRFLKKGQKAESQIWFPLKPSTQAIVIPPRPFIRHAFESGSLKNQVTSNWERAVERSLGVGQEPKG